MLFLAGGAVTVAAGFETVVFVGEGATAPVQAVGTPGNLLIKNNAFSAPRREDGSFEDFSTDLSVYRGGQEIARETVRVNDPLRLEGFVFHQNTFGPAAELTITDAAGALVWSGPLLLDDELLGLPQGFMTVPGADVGLVAVLSEGADGAPQLVLQGVGPADPESGQNETLFLATVPLGVTTDPEVTAGHSITWEAVGSWTGMVIRNDPGQPVIWLAFGLLIVGLVLTFYFPRRRAWARVADGPRRAGLRGRPLRRRRGRVREADRRCGAGHGRENRERNGQIADLTPTHPGVRRRTSDARIVAGRKAQRDGRRARGPRAGG